MEREDPRIHEIRIICFVPEAQVVPVPETFFLKPRPGSCVRITAFENGQRPLLGNITRVNRDPP